ncbi:MAG: hypothetical protein ACRYFS_16330 [Janthinobacterium lividum]
MIQFSPDKKRVHCGGCGQLQPVMDQRIDGTLTLVCSACLHPISTKPADLEAAHPIIKGTLRAMETVVTLTESGKKALDDTKVKKVLPKPITETRPATTEGTR